MQRYLFFAIMVSLSISILITPYDLIFVNSQTTTNPIVNNSWIRKRDNAYVTMNLYPMIPVIDHKTKIGFDIRKLNNLETYNHMVSNTTITDSSG